MTLEQVEARQRQAVAFARNALGDDDLADSLEGEDPRDYAARKGLKVSNPIKRKRTMANGNDMTKADLENCVDQAIDILDAAYTPESSREDLAAAVGDALDALQGNGGDEDDDDDGDDNDDAV